MFREATETVLTRVLAVDDDVFGLQWVQLPSNGSQSDGILSCDSLVVNGLDSGRREKQDTASMQRVYLQVATIRATSLCLRARSCTLQPECTAHPEALDDPVSAAADTAPALS